MNARTESIRTRGCGLLAALLLSLAGMPAQAEDVVLNPGYIEGTVSIDGVTINQATVYANGGGPEYQAQTTTYDGNYDLTVNVPKGESLDYSVYAYVHSNRNYLRFATQTVNVSDGDTSTLDFTLLPGFIQGTVTLTGADLDYGYVYAYSSGANPTSAEGQLDSDGSFSFPVQPNDNIQVSGYLYDSNGHAYYLETRYVNVGAGDTVTENWEIAPGSGRIYGDIAVLGPVTVDYHYVYAYGSGSASTSVYGNGAYELVGLDAGDWTLYAQSYLNGYDDYLSHPSAAYGNPITLIGGDEVQVDIQTQASFINGAIGLGGSRGWADVNSAYLYANGVSGTDAEGGYAYDRVDSTSGAFDLVVTGGDWTLSNLQLSFYNSDPDNYLQSWLYFSDYTLRENAVSLDAGETVDGLELSYKTGTVTVNFSVADGTELSSPRLDAYCQKFDESGTQTSYASGNADGPSTATLVGKATFVGIPSDCTLTAWAYVGGSQVTFGQVQVEILPGTDIIVDIGGPTLTLSSPPAEDYTTEATVEVSGLATDDVEVSSITINGTAVPFVSSGNTADPNEVAFSATVPLDWGPNIIETVATDQSGKLASDTRTVYRDGGPPVLDWSPADGTATTEASITVAGTATDDVEVTRITVNGTEVSFAPTGNASDPNEVSFSTTLTLVDGANAIQVRATDSSNRTTTETRTVTKTEVVEPPMTCDANGDEAINIDDINLIMAARNQPATSADDPRDADGNGWITVLDARMCVLRCTNLRCAR